MPTLWRTAGGLVYANSGRPAPFTATLSQLEDCCCSPSVSPSVSPFGGDGWYCIKTWIDDQHLPPSCADLVCAWSTCTYVADEAAWASHFFGTCTCDTPECRMKTTDGVLHATEAACIAAGCSC